MPVSEGKGKGKTQKFIDASEEIVKQLDVAYLIRKMIFFDTVVWHLMEEH